MSNEEDRSLTYEEKVTLERMKSDILRKIAKLQKIVDSSSFMISEHYANIKHDKNRVTEWHERLSRELSMMHHGGRETDSISDDLMALNALIAIDELREQYRNVSKSTDTRGYSLG